MNNKIFVFSVTLIGFLALFLVMDQLLQSWQGLELFPSGEGH